MSDIIFTTDRLVVRNLTMDDLDDYYKMQSNPNVMQYIKPALNYEEAKSELMKFIGYYTDLDKFYHIWALTTIGSNQLIGICGVYQNQQSEYEIAYRLTESEWGIGYGSEIAESVINYSLKELQLPQLVAYVYTENVSSVKILETHMAFLEESVHESIGIMGRKYVANL